MFKYTTLTCRSIKKDYDNIKNQNASICSKCRGSCCKRGGCYFSPEDFKEISFEYLETQLGKGYISINLQNDSIFYPDTYILKVRDRGVGIVDTGYRNSEYSPCSLLTDNGCKLSYEERPSGGKLYIPEYENGFYHCYTNYKIRDCCNEWFPYQEILVQLASYFSHRDIPCSL